MKKLAILILFVTRFGWGEESPLISRVYQLKYADPVGLMKLLQPFLTSQVGARAEFDQHLKALSINAHQDTFPEIELMMKRFDVPPPPVLNIDVTIYLMSALGTPSTGAVPPELEAVVKQL